MFLFSQNVMTSWGPDSWAWG